MLWSNSGNVGHRAIQHQQLEMDVTSIEIAVAQEAKDQQVLVVCRCSQIFHKIIFIFPIEKSIQRYEDFVKRLDKRKPLIIIPFEISLKSMLTTT